MNLPPDIQRLLPYIAVGVLAVVGLLLVVRGVAPSGGGNTSTTPAQIRTGTNPGGGSATKGGSAKSAKPARAKRSAAAYVGCVEQAVDTAALEKCQALLP